MRNMAPVFSSPKMQSDIFIRRGRSPLPPQEDKLVEEVFSFTGEQSVLRLGSFVKKWLSFWRITIAHYNSLTRGLCLQISNLSGQENK